uniref:WGS project CAEQ00000000 data, annotated contig 2120 n=1 Tax=Trypanosoma congolense (strain IL3000) TaxID=1068625 RepID=F9WBM0_TRYCI|nr:unnamed protein product [Trypanosoma congolense IL3000]
MEATDKIGESPMRKALDTVSLDGKGLRATARAAHSRKCISHIEHVAAKEMIKSNKMISKVSSSHSQAAVTRRRVRAAVHPGCYNGSGSTNDGNIPSTARDEVPHACDGFFYECAEKATTTDMKGQLAVPHREVSPMSSGDHHTLVAAGRTCNAPDAANIPAEIAAGVTDEKSDGYMKYIEAHEGRIDYSLKLSPGPPLLSCCNLASSCAVSLAEKSISCTCHGDETGGCPNQIAGPTMNNSSDIVATGDVIGGRSVQCIGEEKMVPRIVREFEGDGANHLCGFHDSGTCRGANDKALGGKKAEQPYNSREVSVVRSLCTSPVCLKVEPNYNECNHHHRRDSYQGGTYAHSVVMGHSRCASGSASQLSTEQAEECSGCNVEMGARGRMRWARQCLNPIQNNTLCILLPQSPSFSPLNAGSPDFMTHSKTSTSSDLHSYSILSSVSCRLDLRKHSPIAPASPPVLDYKKNAQDRGGGCRGEEMEKKQPPSPGCWAWGSDESGKKTHCRNRHPRQRRSGGDKTKYSLLSIAKPGAAPNFKAVEVLPGLFLGSYADSMQPSELAQRNIFLVLNVAAECPVTPEMQNNPYKVRYLHVPMHDHSDEDIMRHFVPLSQLIHTQLHRRQCAMAKVRDEPVPSPESTTFAGQSGSPSFAIGDAAAKSEQRPNNSNLCADESHFNNTSGNGVAPDRCESYTEGSVLVHCRKGVSRSAAIVLSYLMIYGDELHPNACWDDTNDAAGVLRRPLARNKVLSPSCLSLPDSPTQKNITSPSSPIHELIKQMRLDNGTQDSSGVAMATAASCDTVKVPVASTVDCWCNTALREGSGGAPCGCCCCVARRNLSRSSCNAVADGSSRVVRSYRWAYDLLKWYKRDINPNIGFVVALQALGGEAGSP